MCSRFLSLALLFASMSIAAGASPLRICADPDNLPFSNRAAQGFDNQIATMVAQALGRPPQFVWARSRRGFMREQFNKGACDILMGVPVGLRAVATTKPYYQSTYVFVTPKREHLQIARFDDPHLNGRRIGLQVLEENLSPPSLPLVRNGHAAQLVGFESFGAREGDVVRAVADGRVGTAVVWGPVAGYFAHREHLPVSVTLVTPAVDSSGVPFTYSVAIGVHKKDSALLTAINTELPRLQPKIARVLAGYYVPMVSTEEGQR